MVTLKEIKENLDILYGHNIFRKCRKREFSMARKVFIAIAVNYGYKNKEITDYCGIKHDLIIYYTKTINNISDKDLHFYNECVAQLGLELEPLTTVSRLTLDVMVNETYREIKKLNRADLIFFINKYYNPFKKEIELRDS